LQKIYRSTNCIIDFLEDGVKVGYTDSDRESNIKSTLMDKCRDEKHTGDASTRAVTNKGSLRDKDGRDNKGIKPDTIQLCP
jgi:hypothetical protein